MSGIVSSIRGTMTSGAELDRDRDLDPEEDRAFRESERPCLGPALNLVYNLFKRSLNFRIGLGLH